MPITINQPKILATSQEAEFCHLRIDRDGQGKLSAEVCFNLFNENGEAIGAERLTYSGKEFNTFWYSFNTGTFLYNELYKEKEGVSLTDLDLEDDFINPTPPPPPEPPPAPQPDDEL